MRTRLTAAACTLLMLIACGEQAPPTSPELAGSEDPGLDVDVLASRRGGPPNSSARWTRTSNQLFALRPPGPPPDASRFGAYLALAQYRAVSDVEGWRHRRTSRAGAAAGASVVVLSQFYPQHVALINAELEAQRADYCERGGKAEAFAEGEALGREVAAAVLAEAATDGVGVTPLPPQPVGPGYWVSSGAPTVKAFYGARPFFLTNGNEINSPPPPAFGSREFQDALAVVRAYSDTRTPDQVAQVLKWVPFSLPLFNAVAADMIDRYHVSELRAARILAYANTAAFDAILGCFHTKFTYWFIRPTQADPGIVLATGLPNHPSYPSAHSCQTGAFQAVLTHAFPQERHALAAMADEASMSRIIGGLHYPFDGDAGLELGRKAGRLALQRGLK